MTESNGSDLISGVGRRVNALKKLQITSTQLWARYEAQCLDYYVQEFSPIFKEMCRRRHEIICGKVELSDDDCHHGFESAGDSEPESEVSSSLADATPPYEGIPDFWFKAMANSGAFDDLVTAEDEKILLYLKDISVDFKNLKETSFTLVFEFQFAANDYFKDQVLTKEFDVKFGVDPKNPWDPLPPYYPTESRASKINWNDQMKPSKKENPYSFFDFFSTQNKRETDDLEDVMAEEWQLAFFMLRKLIPWAVLYYTGDICDDEDDDESSHSSAFESDESDD